MKLESLTNQKVAVIRRQAEIRRGELVVSHAKLGEWLDVAEYLGERLMLKRRDRWTVDPADIVLESQAVDYFTSQIAEQPTAENYIARGMVLLRRADAEDAIVDFEAAIQADSCNPWATAHRLTAQEHIGKVNEATYRQAIEDYTTIIKAQPKNAEAMYLRANCRLTLGEGQNAASDLLAAREIKPNDVQIWKSFAYMSVMTGEFVTAAYCYNKALKIDSHSPHLYFHRGEVLNHLGEFHRAIDDFRTVLRHDPHDINALGNLAYSYRGLQKYDQAIQKYNQITEINPQEPSAFLGRGKVWEVQGYFRDAILEYQKAANLDPKSKLSHAALANLYMNCLDENYRDMQLAIEFARNACDLADWKDDVDLKVLAEACFQADQHDEAFAVLDKAIEKGGPNTDMFIEMRGRFFYEIEERNAASKSWWPFG